MERMTHEQRTLADAAFAQKLSVTHHAYIDIAGDLVAGMLLSQILYWHGTGKDGTTRAKIQKGGHLWIAKTRTDWHDEIRITPKQYDRASKILKEKNFIEIRTMKFNGNPTTHIRIIPEAINAALDAWKWEQVKTLLPDEEEPAAAGCAPLVNNGIPEGETTESLEGETRYSPLRDNGMTQRAISSYTENVSIENSREHTQPDAPQAAAGESVQQPGGLLNAQDEREKIAADFEQCWAEYPRKEGKQKARKAFERAVRGTGSMKPNGEPYTSAEILAEVILYRQYIERMVELVEMEKRYIPTGGSWFEREGWTDDVPSISSTFPELMDGIEFNRNTAELRRCAAMIDKAPESDRKPLLERMRQIRAALPY